MLPLPGRFKYRRRKNIAIDQKRGGPLPKCLARVLVRVPCFLFRVSPKSGIATTGSLACSQKRGRRGGKLGVLHGRVVSLLCIDFRCCILSTPFPLSTHATPGLIDLFTSPPTNTRWFGSQVSLI